MSDSEEYLANKNENKNRNKTNRRKKRFINRRKYAVTL